LKRTQKPFFSQPKQRTTKPSKKALAFGFSSRKRKQPSKKFKLLYKGRTIHNHGQIRPRITKKSKFLSDRTHKSMEKEPCKRKRKTQKDSLERNPETIFQPTEAKNCQTKQKSFSLWVFLMEEKTTKKKI